LDESFLAKAIQPTGVSLMQCRYIKPLRSMIRLYACSQASANPREQQYREDISRFADRRRAACP
jgi:hypothetical protein